MLLVWTVFLWQYFSSTVIWHDTLLTFINLRYYPQVMKERVDEIAREERRLEKRKAEKAKTENSVITGIQLF